MNALYQTLGDTQKAALERRATRAERENERLRARNETLEARGVWQGVFCLVVMLLFIVSLIF